MEAKNRIGEMKFHLLAVAIGATLTGCSSLKGARFNHEASKSGDTLAGVPFTLNRPVPTVTRTPGAAGAPDRYAIKFEYLPDPNGRFTLQIDPALISSVDFQMTFDTNGSLIETTAKTIDHTGALLTALGKAVAAFGAADTDAPKSESELAQGLLDEGKDLLAAKDARLIDSVKTVDIGKTAQRQVTPADQEAWSRLGERLLSAAAIGQARKSFVYVNRAEYEILTTLLVRHRQARDPSKFPATFNTAVTNAAQLKDQAKVQDIITAYRRMDKRRVAKLRSEILASRATLRATYGQVPNNDNKTALDNNYTLLQVANAAKLKPEDSFLVDVADLEHLDWQRRIVAHLNAEIEARRHILQIGTAELPSVHDVKKTPSQAEAAANVEVAKTSKSNGGDTHLIQLQDRKAAVLEVLPERTRRLQIATSLASTKVPKELKGLREEHAALEALEVAAETALKAKTPESAKPDEPLQAEIMVMAADATPSSQEIKTHFGTKRPNYVLVLQPVIASGGSAPTTGIPPVKGTGVVLPDINPLTSTAPANSVTTGTPTAKP